jgi:hypothetical protein
MTDKNLGANSTYLDPEGRSFESVVYRQDAPVSNAELNLNQEIQSFARQEALRSKMPSGFLTGDFFENTLTNYTFGTTPNTFGFDGELFAHVNGWVLPIEFTNSSTARTNLLELPAPPINLGTIGVDFVYLEVWRALVEIDPATANKPSATQIYRHGNVLSDAATWLDDDLGDAPVVVANPGLETTRRVQIQYAIRTTRLASNSTRIGYDDANIEAQGPNGAPVASATFTQSATDKGLWVAGDTVGQPNAIAGTVDGFVYSIPICLVYRRNSSAFDFLSNGNGGIVGVGTVTPSDRPDGFYSDQIVLNDIQDLRASVAPEDRDWERAMKQSFALLLDNELRSFVGQSSFTDFYVGGNNESFGTRYLKADDLLPSASPDKPSGNTFRNADGICTVFTDRPHLERYTVEYDAATFAAGATWVGSDTITLDFVATNIEDEQPAGTVITDVLSVRLNTNVGTTGLPEFVEYSVTGLGTGTVTVTLGDPPVLPDSSDVWIEYEVSYPSGSGLTSLVKEGAANFDVLVHNPSSFNALFAATFTDDQAGRDAIRPFLTTEYEDGPHREILLKYRPDTTRVLSTVSTGVDTLLLPETAYVADPLNPAADFTVTVNGGGKTITAISEDRKTLTFDPPEANGGLAASVEFTPNRPIPRNGPEMTLYYLAPGIQAVPFELLDNPADPVNLSLELEPLYVSDKVYAVTASSGSVTTPFPYEGASQQIPVAATAGSTFQKEAELNAPGPISIDDFDADVGMLELQSFVPLALTTNITLQNPVNVIGSQTLEFIDHYTAVADDSYVPTAIAQSLSGPVEHKAFIPFVAKLTRDTDFGPQGTAVLVVLSQYYDYSSLLPSNLSVEENRVTFTPNLSAAAIYRLKANPLVK